MATSVMTPRRKRCGAVSILVLSGLAFVASPLEAQDPPVGHIYWIDVGTLQIQRARLDGTDVEGIVSVPTSTLHIAVDGEVAKMYWNEAVDEGMSKICGANLDGTEIVDVVVRTGTIGGIAVDGPGGKIYYGGITAGGENGILRANLDGSGEEEVTHEQDVDGIALDLSRGRVFQLDRCDDFIFLHTLDGSGPATLVESAWGMAFDPAENHLYWLGVRAGIAGVHRLRFGEGSVRETVVPDSSDISGLALGIENGKVYWGERSSGKIRWANLDGTGVADVVTDLEDPFAVAVYSKKGGSAGAPFVRGDANADALVNISDAVGILRFLFQGAAPPPCGKSADADDSGQVDLSDAVFLLDSLFRGGRAIPEPFESCGTDTTSGDLTCDSYPPCA